MGEVLILHNITRYCDGLYECNAENGVPPFATKSFEVIVECKYSSLYTPPTYKQTLYIKHLSKDPH